MLMGVEEGESKYAFMPHERAETEERSGSGDATTNPHMINLAN